MPDQLALLFELARNIFAIFGIVFTIFGIAVLCTVDRRCDASNDCRCRYHDTQMANTTICAAEDDEPTEAQTAALETHLLEPREESPNEQEVENRIASELVFELMPDNDQLHDDTENTGAMFTVPFETDGTPKQELFAESLPEHEDSFDFSYSVDEALRHFFEFSAKRQSDRSYDVFIRNRPHYGDRSISEHDTHRFDVDSPRERICFRGENRPKTLRDACWFAVMWAECTSNYIQTGRRF